MIRLALAKQRRAIFMVHRVELVEQAVERLAMFGIHAGVIKAGYKPDLSHPVQVACIPSLVRRKQWPDAELVIFDESHHIASASWSKVAAHYRDAGAWIVGITATPQRLDGKGLGDIFEQIIEPVTTRELIDGGFLIEPQVYAPPSISLQGIGKIGGDYSLPELAERMEGLTAPITEYWERFARGHRTLVFAVNIEHSQQICAALSAKGARAVHVDGTSSPHARMAANHGLGDGSLEVVTQCALWSEGWDRPELDRLIIARPTMSMGLHRQMIGRVMRPAPGKAEAIILDHAGNTHRHGLITDEVEWSLDDAVRSDRDTVEPVRTCSACYAIVPPAADICPACGQPLGREETAVDPGVDNPGVLVRVDMTARKAGAIERARQYHVWVREASGCGYKLGWARRKHKYVYGTWPRLRAVELDCYDCPGHVVEATGYGSRCAWCYAEVAVQ